MTNPGRLCPIELSAKPFPFGEFRTEWLGLVIGGPTRR